jgi:hypothetical protein
MAVVAGGQSNCASGACSFIGGGQGNTATGAYSSAVGCGLTASRACTFYANNTFTCGAILQGYNSSITSYTINYWFSGGTTNIATLSSPETDTTVVATIEWATLYSYAGTNLGIGQTVAGTRRGSANTVWVSNSQYVLNNGDTGNAPTFAWSNGVLQATVGGSVLVAALIRITVHSATLTINV